MSEMIERVARAICLKDGKGYPDELVEPFGRPRWMQHEFKARAAIEAMRDVEILSVLLAGKKSLYSCSEDPEIDDARKCFIAMIDESLK